LAKGEPILKTSGDCSSVNNLKKRTKLTNTYLCTVGFNKGYTRLLGCAARSWDRVNDHAVIILCPCP